MPTTENITVLFTDLVGSTELSASLSPEASDDVRRRHFSALRQAIATSGGTEVKNLGDGLMVVFPVASAALVCAVAMQQAVYRDNAKAERSLGLRVALSAGEATKEDGDYFGEPVVEAARLCARAEGGQILIADVVRANAGRRSPHAFTSLGELELKGLPEPIETLAVGWEPLTEEEATSSGGVPLPARLAHRPGVGVVGREEELASLSASAKRVASGEGSEVVLIAGEPGQGKTTLVSEIARQAHEDGMTVLLGRCDEEVGSPYRPFHEALTHYVAHAEEALLRTHVAAHGGELARLVPALQQRLGDLPAPQSTDPDTERYLLYAAAVGLLELASVQTPVLLMLDDLHWVDKPSLQLLRHVVANTSAARLLILGTYRDAELSASHPLTEALGGLLREPGVSSLHLKGLEDTGVIAFMEEAAGHGLDDAGVGLAHQVYRETDGNPFFVAEMLRNLSESGTIYQDDTGRWTADDTEGQLALPHSVRAVIGSRLARLGDDATKVLSTASVIGRDFNLDLLAAVTGSDEDELIDLLDQAQHAALVAEVPGTPGRYSFAHALVQHTLYEDLGGTEAHPTAQGRGRGHRAPLRGTQRRASGRTGPPLPAGHQAHRCGQGDVLRPAGRGCGSGGSRSRRRRALLRPSPRAGGTGSQCRPGRSHRPVARPRRCPASGWHRLVPRDPPRGGSRGAGARRHRSSGGGGTGQQPRVLQCHGAGRRREGRGARSGARRSSRHRQPGAGASSRHVVHGDHLRQPARTPPRPGRRGQSDRSPLGGSGHIRRCRAPVRHGPRRPFDARHGTGGLRGGIRHGQGPGRHREHCSLPATSVSTLPFAPASSSLPGNVWRFSEKWRRSSGSLCTCG